MSDGTGRQGRGQPFRDSRRGSPGPVPSRWTQAASKWGAGTPGRAYTADRLEAKMEIPD